MENFKLIKEESYESIAGYLKYIYQLTELEHPLAFIDTDKRRYMVTKILNLDEPVDNGFLITYEEDGEIRPVGLFYDDDSYSVNKLTSSYKVKDDMVVRENKYNLFKEQLSCIDTIESSPKKSFNYHQVDPLNRVVIDMHYIIDGYGDPNIALPYLKNKKPSAIEITTQKHIIPKTKDYVLSDDTYYRYKRLNNDAVLLLSILKKYPYEDMMNLIQSYGYNTTIPDDLIHLYNGQDEEAKTLKRVADVYRNNTKL